MSMLPCTELGAGLLGAGCHKTLFVCRQRTGNKVELLVFSATKGRDSFTAILASASVPVTSGVPSCDTANIRALQFFHRLTHKQLTQQALQIHSCMLWIF